MTFCHNFLMMRPIAVSRSTSGPQTFERCLFPPLTRRSREMCFYRCFTNERAPREADRRHPHAGKVMQCSVFTRKRRDGLQRPYAGHSTYSFCWGGGGANKGGIGQREPGDFKVHRRSSKAGGCFRLSAAPGGSESQTHREKPALCRTSGRGGC